MERLLTIAVLLPLIAAFVLFLFPANNPKAIRAVAMFATGVSLLITLTLFANFDRVEERVSIRAQHPVAAELRVLAEIRPGRHLDDVAVAGRVRLVLRRIHLQ